MRAIGYGCVRMENPDQFAQVLLAEDKGWSASEVNDLWEHSVNSPVLLDRKIPVHLTYFTTVVDDTGNVTSFADIYGLDKKLAMALFGNTTAPAQSGPEMKKPRQEANASALPSSTRLWGESPRQRSWQLPGTVTNFEEAVPHLGKFSTQRGSLPPISLYPSAPVLWSEIREPENPSLCG